MRFILAAVLTLTMLHVARTNSRGQSDHLSYSDNGVAFDIVTVPKAPENGSVHIVVGITGAVTPDSKIVVRYSESGQDAQTSLSEYATVVLETEDAASGVYGTEIAVGPRGDKVYYYFEVLDSDNNSQAAFTRDGEQPFVLKSIGQVPTVVVVCHVVLMFLTVFFVALALIHAFGLIRTGADAHLMSRNFLLATLFAFLGGCCPFGFAMNWYAFGTIWEGVPFGTDATDNKTQLIFVYLVYMVLASFGSLTRGRWGRDLFSPGVLGWFGVSAFVLMIAIYLIPHSIQFTPDLTHAVCYSFIGLVGLLYVFGLVWGRGKSRRLKWLSASGS